MGQAERDRMLKQVMCSGMHCCFLTASVSEPDPGVQGPARGVYPDEGGTRGKESPHHASSAQTRGHQAEPEHPVTPVTPVTPVEMRRSSPAVLPGIPEQVDPEDRPDDRQAGEDRVPPGDVEDLAALA